jgi:Leucine-rich repeat (LRR) protein
MFWENGTGCKTPPRINSQENQDYYGPLLTKDYNTEVKKRIARRMKQFGITAEKDLTNLVIEGATTGPSFSDSDKEYLERFYALEVLALNETGLESLQSMPALPQLMKLELCYNQISGGLHFLNQYPLLRILKLRNNQIKTFETLAPLKKNNLLNDLDLYDNPVTELPKYRSTVFELLE